MSAFLIGPRIDEVIFTFCLGFETLTQRSRAAMTDSEFIQLKVLETKKEKKGFPSRSLSEVYIWSVTVANVYRLYILYIAQR